MKRKIDGGGGGGDKIDSRFVYGEPPKWRHGQKQFLWGSEYLTIQPTTKTATLFEFELPTGSTVLFGNQTGFYISGTFQFKAAAAADTTYATVPVDHSSTVALIPNWFDHLIKDIQLYHGHMPLNPHDVPRYSDAFLNTYLYANMYQETKDCLMKEPFSPGRCVGTKSTDFALATEDCIWQKYAAVAFNNKKMTFKYVPLHVFPFMQQPNFCTDGRPPAALPLPSLEKISIQMQLKEDQGGIFIKKADNTNVYRFKIDTIELVVEEARLNPSMERHFLNKKGLVYFPGLTKFGMAENVTTGVQQHRVRFQDVPYPEGLFIFALPKTALSGTFTPTTVTGRVFTNHNIQDLSVTFNNMPLAIKSPNFGEFRMAPIELKQVGDHFEQPPFGVLQNPSCTTRDAIKEGGEDSASINAFPHIYISLCPSGKETRIIPVGADGSIINKNGDLDIAVKFTSTGSANATYMFYIFYSDTNMVLDMNAKSFSPMYKRSKAN